MVTGGDLLAGQPSGNKFNMVIYGRGPRKASVNWLLVCRSKESFSRYGHFFNMTGTDGGSWNADVNYNNHVLEDGHKRAMYR